MFTNRLVALPFLMAIIVFRANNIIFLISVFLAAGYIDGLLGVSTSCFHLFHSLVHFSCKLCCSFQHFRGASSHYSSTISSTVFSVFVLSLSSSPRLFSECFLPIAVCSNVFSWLVVSLIQYLLVLPPSSFYRLVLFCTFSRLSCSLLSVASQPASLSLSPNIPKPYTQADTTHTLNT